MTDDIVTIPKIETTKSELIDYIGTPCISNWRRLATMERKNKPVKDGGVCGKCMFRGFLEKYMVDNPKGSQKIVNFMTEVRDNPKMYPRISKILERK